MRMQVLGLCRFSYLGGRGFQSAPEDREARRAYLYDPDRLARRWYWFENVTLPALRAQTDPDFTLVVMTGPDLPEPWLGRLRALEDEIPQLRLSLIRPMNYHLAACDHALRPFRADNVDVVAHFRMDDDDAVAVDFIERVRADFPLVEAACASHDGAAIDYMRGLVLRASRTGLKVTPRILHFASAGLVVYLPPEDMRSAVHLPHWCIAEHMPVLGLADAPMFCRLLNHDNDSGEEGPGHDWDLPADALHALMWKRFRLRRGALNRDAKAGLAMGAAAGTDV